MATVHIKIDDTTPRIAYTATSGQTKFTVPFSFFADADLVVSVNATTKTLITDYTVSGAGDTGGGFITFLSGLTVSDAVVIVRTLPIERTTDFPASGPFKANPDLNTELDRIIAMQQQLEDLIQRTIRLNDTDTTTNVNIPAAATRANKFLAFDASGDVIAATTVTGATVSTFMETVLDDTTAAAARTTLGITNTDVMQAVFNWQNFR